jgi:hypothetical protein
MKGWAANCQRLWITSDSLHPDIPSRESTLWAEESISDTRQRQYSACDVRFLRRVICATTIA